MLKPKHVVIGRIAAGEDPAAIAEDMKISIATVIRWKNEVIKGIKENDVEILAGLDATVLTNLAGLAKGLAPVEFEESIDRVVAGLSGLQRLQEAVTSTALVATTKLKQHIATTDSTSELVMLVESLGLLNKNFFHSQAPQINIQTNVNGENTKTYGEFLSDVPTK